MEYSVGIIKQFFLFLNVNRVNTNGSVGKKKAKDASACATGLRLLLVSFRTSIAARAYVGRTLSYVLSTDPICLPWVSHRVSDHPVVIIRGYLLVTAIRYTAMRPFLFNRVVYFRNGACNFSIELNILTITMRNSRSYS